MRENKNKSAKKKRIFQENCNRKDNFYEELEPTYGEAKSPELSF